MTTLSIPNNIKAPEHIVQGLKVVYIVHCFNTRAGKRPMDSKQAISPCDVGEDFWIRWLEPTPRRVCVKWL